jgi:transposase
LLTDSDGEPMSVSIFPGNTNDLGTFTTQVNSLKHTFKQEHITLVGDRGMIRGPQQKEVNAAGFNYISALHKAEIETLLKSGEVQLGFFDDIVHETLLKDGRRLVTRCNPIRREELAATHRGFKAKMDAWVKAANTYLMEHPKAREGTQLRQGTQRLKRGRLDAWVSLEVSDRRLSLVEDEGKLREHTKLDGCYAIVSDLTVTEVDTQTLHDRYKDLSKVESDFRTLKHGHLEITRGHTPSPQCSRSKSAAACNKSGSH